LPRKIHPCPLAWQDAEAKRQSKNSSFAVPGFFEPGQERLRLHDLRLTDFFQGENILVSSDELVGIPRNGGFE
jgi:hypothetical protein